MFLSTAFFFEHFKSILEIARRVIVFPFPDALLSPHTLMHLAFWSLVAFVAVIVAHRYVVELVDDLADLFAGFENFSLTCYVLEPWRRSKKPIEPSFELLRTVFSMMDADSLGEAKYVSRHWYSSIMASQSILPQLHETLPFMELTTLKNGMVNIDVFNYRPCKSPVRMVSIRREESIYEYVASLRPITLIVSLDKADLGKMDELPLWWLKGVQKLEVEHYQDDACKKLVRRCSNITAITVRVHPRARYTPRLQNLAQMLAELNNSCLRIVLLTPSWTVRIDDDAIDGLMQNMTVMQKPIRLLKVICQKCEFAVSFEKLVKFFKHWAAMDVLERSGDGLIGDDDDDEVNVDHDSQNFSDNSTDSDDEDYLDDYDDDGDVADDDSQWFYRPEERRLVLHNVSKEGRNLLHSVVRHVGTRVPRRLTFEDDRNQCFKIGSTKLIVRIERERSHRRRRQIF